MHFCQVFGVCLVIYGLESSRASLTVRYEIEKGLRAVYWRAKTKDSRQLARQGTA